MILLHHLILPIQRNLKNILYPSCSSDLCVNLM